VPDCGTLDFGCKAADAVSNAIDDLADKIVTAVAESVASLGTFWINTGSPDVEQSGAVSFIRDSLTWYVAGAAVLSVIVAGARMAWEQRSQPGLDLLRSLGILIGIGGASTVGISLALAASDALARWLIDRSTGDFAGGMVQLLQLTSADDQGVAVILLILLGLLALLAALVQMALLVVRNGFLVVLAGTLPLAASASNTAAGKAWLTRSVGWLVAFILYKPAAAVIYATAFQLVGEANGGDGITSAITGITLMIMALVALPALLKLTAPLVAAAAGSGGGSGGAALAAAAIPTGAAMVGRRSAAAAAGGAAAAGAGSAGATGASGVSGSRGATASATAGASTGTGSGGGAGGGAVATLTRGQAVAQVLRGTTSGASPSAPSNDDDEGGPRGSR
jgi:type IV secretion system protein TrbL